jgi:hypothetical protein
MRRLRAILGRSACLSVLTVLILALSSVMAGVGSPVGALSASKASIPAGVVSHAPHAAVSAMAAAPTQCHCCCCGMGAKGNCRCCCKMGAMRCGCGCAREMHPAAGAVCTCSLRGIPDPFYLVSTKALRDTTRVVDIAQAPLPRISTVSLEWPLSNRSVRGNIPLTPHQPPRLIS